MKRTFRPGGIALLVSVVLLAGGCEQQKTEKIKWQLPLEAPADPHSAQSHEAVPAWAAARQGSADLVILHKTTTRLTTVTVASGAGADVDDVRISLLGLASGLRIKNNAFIDDSAVYNPAAFVEVLVHGKMIYRGWLYQEFPELFGVDNSEWTVWLKGISVPPATTSNG
ncbi:DUF2155 domain-containing protein [Mariprofundus erugo]|uniref:DUF2155 domain-containing protein n=1 Tax=Mariprofundus erugo TaxID=2528639 RepID=A0A5R9GL89_9PROT|nr:DUF2155 domain-containing protein [Mariprofundus erugo]TLS65749.1 DUF2155 domain-containing protein [Mariprofundus erugo]TLS77912.1 DUF2155 domain-containing protein [Mariprofundus erugo]